MAGKKNYNRRKGRKKKGPMIKYIQRPLGPMFPNTMLARHNFAKQIILTSTDNQISTDENIDAEQVATFRCNNIFDPDLSVGTGADKARFYDEMRVHYKQYKVIGAKMTAKFINLSNDQCYVGCVRDLTQLTAGEIPQIMEHRGSKLKILNPAQSGKGSVSTFVVTYSPAKQFNVKKSQVSSMDELAVSVQGTSANDGDYNTVWNLFMAPVDTAYVSNVDTRVEVSVKIEYLVRWEDRQILPDAST